MDDATSFLTPGSAPDVLAAAQLGGGTPAAAYQAEYNVLGIKTNLDIPLTTVGSGNNAGMKSVVGSSNSQTTQTPVSPSGNVQSSNSVSYLDGIGWWMGYASDGTPQFFLGDSSGDYVAWDGSALNIVGGINVSSINIPDTTTANSFHIDTAGNAWWGTNVATGYATAPARILNTGAATFTGVTITGGSISGTPISAIPNNSSTDISLLGFTQNLTFTSASATQVNWSSGTVTLSNGRSFSIVSGNTGTMAALTYIYLDPAISSTVLQTTTTFSTAIGANKILIAAAQNNATAASVITYGGGQPVLDGTSNIAAASITANAIAASTITAAKLNVSQLSAITADLGSINAGSININSGAASISTLGAAVFKSIQVGGSSIQYQLNDNGYFSYGDGADGTGFSSIAFDAASTVADTATSPATVSHTTTGTDRMLVIGVVVSNNSAAATGTATAVTYNGVALTKVRTDTRAQASTSYETSIWMLANPASGSNTVSITFSGGTAPRCTAVVSSYTGVLQGSFADAVNGNSGTTAGDQTLSVTTTVDNCWIFGIGVNSAASGASVTADQTSRASGNMAAALATNMRGEDTNAVQTPAGAHTVGFTMAGTTNKGWAMSFAAFRPALAGITASSSTNYALTRDIYYTSLTVPTGIMLNPSGYRIFVNGTLTVNGTIARNGNAGSNGVVVGPGSLGGAGGAALADGYLKGSLAGANGATSVGRVNTSGNPGTVGSNTSNSLGSNGANSGAAGSGSDGGGGAGANGGAATASNVRLIANWHLFTLLDISSSGSTVKFDNSASAAGGGGGGGGGGSAGGSGAGGGSAGGIVAIYARVLTIGAGGSITAIGGAGGAGGGGNVNGGGGGGGGGGNGGIIVLAYNVITNAGTLSVSGGAGGAGGNAGGGSDGFSGSNGVSGSIYSFNLSI